MENHLKLPSLEILRFRGIRHLRIDRLGRVNLIVGKNNVGKTSVLEAIRLYGEPGLPDVLIDLLQSRDEFEVGRNLQDSFSTRVPVENLFHGRTRSIGDAEAIEIGPIDDENERMRIVLDFHSSPLPLGVHPESEGNEGLVPNKTLNLKYTRGTHTIWAPILNTLALLKFRDDFFNPVVTGLTRTIMPGLTTMFVGPGGPGPDQISRLWDAIALTELEEEVLGSMRLVSPEIEKLSLRAMNEKSTKRIPFVKVANHASPVPLRSLGDGVNRMFAIALSLVSARDGILAIDEIENGLHYSIQADLWRFIFHVASRLNVQIFATSHSYDCIRAFQVAAEQHEQEGVLIRLQQRDGDIRVTELDEEELGIAVEGKMEVR